MPKLLIVGAETPALQRVVPLLLRADFTASRVPRADDAAELLAGQAFDLVIVRVPVSGMPLDELLGQVRDPKGLNRDAGVLLLAEPETIAEVRSLLGRGVNRVVSLEGPSDRLLLAVADLVLVPPRLAVRTLVQLELWVAHGPVRSLTLTRDLSATGMFVQAGDEFPIGTRLRFELSLPGDDEPIRGEVEVVRRASADEAKAGGIGVRFLSFQDDGRRRLDACLASHDAIT